MADIKTLFRKAYQRARADSILFGRLGKLNPDTSVSLTVDGRVDQLWVTLADKTAVQARNEAGVPHTYGLAVKLRAEGGEGGPRSYVILGRSTRGEISYPDETPPSGVLPHPMEDHSDVVFDDPQAGDFFSYDGDDWINLPLQETVEDFTAAQFTGNSGRVQFSYDDGTGALTAILDVSTADRILYSTGADSWAETAISAFGRTLIAAADAAAGRTALEVTQEHIEDIVGGMVSGNTETNIAVTYDDSTGKLNFVVTTNTEEVQDIVGTLIQDSSSIDWTYDDAGGTLAGAIIDEYVQDVIGAMVSGNTETGIAVTYDDATGKLNFDAQTAGDARYVKLTGNESVGGVKTLTDNPIVSTAVPQITFVSPNQSIVDGTVLFNLEVRADDSSAGLVESIAAYLKYVATGTWNSGNAPGLWTFGALRQQTTGPTVNTYVDDILTIGNKGQVGIGTRDLEQTPANFSSMQLGATGYIYIPTASDGIWFGNNAFNDSGWKRRTAAAASIVEMTGDSIIFHYAATGTIDSSITWTEIGRMAAGKLMLGGLTSVGASLLGLKAGTSTNDAAVGGVLLSSTTQTGNVGTGEDDLASYSVPANTLSANNMSLWFEARGTFTNNANTKQLRVRFGTSGTNLIFDSGAGFSGSATTWVIRGRIFRTGAATQKGHVDALIGTNPRTGGSTSLDQTLSGAVTLKVTGEATSNNDILIETFIVGWDDANT